VSLLQRCAINAPRVPDQAIVHGILFKIARDPRLPGSNRYLFSGVEAPNDELAAKSAGAELRAALSAQSHLRALCDSLGSSDASSVGLLRTLRVPFQVCR
jgi:hypothetical protein